MTAEEQTVFKVAEEAERIFGRLMYAGLLDVILGVLVLMSGIPTAVALGSYWWVALPQILYGILCMVVGVLAFLGVYRLLFMASIPAMDLTKILAVISLILSGVSLIEIIVGGIALNNLTAIVYIIFPIISIIINYYIAWSINALKEIPLMLPR
ncbi:MAG: hypothetical protein ACXQS5_03405 [Candidatus Methanospirareceae archaeon]